MTKVTDLYPFLESKKWYLLFMGILWSHDLLVKTINMYMFLISFFTHRPLHIAIAQGNTQLVEFLIQLMSCLTLDIYNNLKQVSYMTSEIDSIINAK